MKEEKKAQRERGRGKEGSCASGGKRAEWPSSAPEGGRGGKLKRQRARGKAVVGLFLRGIVKVIKLRGRKRVIIQ